MWQFSWKSETKIFDPFFKTFLTNWGKNEDEEEKNWKNEIKFCILHIKIGFCGNFHENPRKKFLNHFFFFLINTRLIQGCCFLGKDLLMIKVVHIVIKNLYFVVYLDVESLPLTYQTLPYIIKVKNLFAAWGSAYKRT